MPLAALWPVPGRSHRPIFSENWIINHKSGFKIIISDEFSENLDFFEAHLDLYSIYCATFSPTAKLAMGSLAQNSSGAIRCSCNTRFRRRFRRVPEGSGADG